MRRILSILFLLQSIIVSAQNPVESVVAVQTINSKFQFIDAVTKLPVDQQLWDETDPFINGFSRVFLEDRFSFVNGKGKLLFPVTLEDARHFVNKLAAVKKDGKWGFIDESGKIVIPYIYDIVFDFEQSVTVAFREKKWWLINNKGGIIAALDITVCYGFKNGVAKISKNDQEGILYPDGKIVLEKNKIVIDNTVPYQPNSNNIAAPCPDNLGFENGNFTNWQCYTGQVDSIGNVNQITVIPSAPIANRHVIYPRAIPSALDPYGLFPTNPPDGSNFAVKLGNTNVGAQAERITYTIHVPLNDSNFSIKYNYAVVLQDPGHTIWTQPRFNAKLLDSATNTYIECASFEYISTAGLPGFEISPVNSSVIFKPWSSVFFSLRGYGGQTLYLEFTTADCVRRAHWGYAYVDVESTCGSPVEIHYDCTFPNATTLTGPPGFEFYNWWDQNYTTLLGTGQQLNMNPGPTINSIIWLEMIPFNNFGCKDTLLIKITGDFDAVFDMSADNGCAPQTFTFYNRNLPSLTTLWDFGDGNTGTGDTVTHTYTVPGTYNVTLNVTVPGGCNGTALHQITIYPTPDVMQPPDQALCNGANTNPVNFTGTLSNTVFNWTNDNTAIGLAASGTGDIASFTAVNTGNSPLIATIRVTPVHLTCAGTTEVFTITVNPTPNVIQPANQVICNGTATNTITFSGAVSGTTFNWVNNNTSIGLAASGNSQIHSFIAINTGNTAVTATITVRPTIAGCSGAPQIFTITVNPTPDLIQPLNQAVCNGMPTQVISFSGTVSNTTFSWSNNNTSIGLAAAGNGNIPSFNAINTGTTMEVATITVTPSASGCPGSSKTFNIRVNPTPNVEQPADQTLCNGSSTAAVSFTGTVTGTNFIWSNNNPNIGLAANGTGNIPAFVTVNNSNIPVTATITVTPVATGCTGSPKTFRITVNPTTHLLQPADQVICNGQTSNLVVFAGSVSGTVFNWTNDNTSIGLAASGTGNIPIFTAVNTTNTRVTAIITVTPVAMGCSGTPKTFIITVNPTPDVLQPGNQALCNGATTQAIVFNGAVNGTVYTWTNSAASIGLPAAGTGNIAPFTAYGNGNSISVATIRVTPVAQGCAGEFKTFTITVNPSPDVVQPPDQSLCNDAMTNTISFTGSMNNAVYNWTNSNPLIGLPASGTGDIAGFMAINRSNTSVHAIITVTPSTGLCPGPAKTFTISVHPTPVVDAGNDKNVCLGNSVQLSASGATNYYWSPADWLNCTECNDPVSTPVNDIQYFIRGVSSFGCEAFDSVNLTIIRPFQMQVSPNDTLCIGESTDLRASGATRYAWSPSTGLNRADIANPAARPNVTTLYRVVGFDGYHCFTDTNFVNIVVGPKPTVNLGPDLNLSTGSIINLNPVIQNGPIINWSWTPSAGLSCTTCPSPQLTIADNTHYRVTVTNIYGCVATDIISIFTFCKSAQVFIPNAFTPDGDGLNDILMVRGKGIFVKNFRIFNRWGELVFEKNNFNPNDIKYGWDGKVRGIPATPDVFVYTSEIICDNGVIYTYKGNTTLLK